MRPACGAASGSVCVDHHDGDQALRCGNLAVLSQPANMDSMQEQHDKTSFIHRRRLKNITRMATHRLFAPVTTRLSQRSLSFNKPVEPDRAGSTTLL